LHALRAAGTAPAGLVCTFTDAFDRVAIHGVRRTLVAEQARSLGVELHQVGLSFPCSNESYESRMRAFCADAVRRGYTHLAFGDLFLEDVRRYRERLFRDSGLALLFPLWGRNTRELAREMTDAGLRAYVTCVDPARAPREWAGAIFDPGFVRRLPAGIDACAENGEFHTFAFAGPMFARPLDVRTGEVVERDGFVFADLLPGTAAG
jgi:uncharacterized protein (TIGR00290 family)